MRFALRIALATYCIVVSVVFILSSIVGLFYSGFSFYAIAPLVMLAFGFVNLVHTAQAFKPYPRLLPASGIATLIAVFALLASSAKDSTVGDGGKDLMWPIVLILNWLAIYGMAAWSSAPETPEKTA